MKILNFGSLNIDNVYTVEEFVRPGETVTAQSRTVFAGGKGLNQSLAAARAGADVIHAGAVGSDGGFLIDLLEQSGVLDDGEMFLHRAGGIPERHIPTAEINQRGAEGLMRCV